MRPPRAPDSDGVKTKHDFLRCTMHATVLDDSVAPVVEEPRQFLGLDHLDAAQSKLVQELKEGISSSGAEMGHEIRVEEINHLEQVVACSKSALSPSVAPLPFDVEVHQLESGQRMVLDTHRLLIPDVSWIKWMTSEDGTAAQAWAVIEKAAKPGAETEIHSGTLQRLQLRELLSVFP